MFTLFDFMFRCKIKGLIIINVKLSRFFCFRMDALVAHFLLSYDVHQFIS